MKRTWISIADKDKPPGHTFVGIYIAEGAGPRETVTALVAMLAKTRGDGNYDIMAVPLEEASPLPKEVVNRFLTQEEIDLYGEQDYCTCDNCSEYRRRYGVLYSPVVVN